MVIGGGVDDEENLNRKSVMMLNDPTINLEEKLKNKDYKCLYEKLAEVPDVGRDSLIVCIWRKRKRRRYGLLLVNDL